MSKFYLVGDGWQKIGDDRDAFSCILIKINAGGNLITLGTKDVEVSEVQGGRLLHFQSGITNDPVHKEMTNPFSRNIDIQSMKFSVMGEYFDYPAIRKSGLILSDIDVDVYWHINRRGHSLDQALHLLMGKITSNSYNEEKNIVTFNVQDSRLSNAKVFPPAVATSEVLDSGVLALDSDFNGWTYPFVVGSVKKVPVLRMTDSTPGDDRYIIMLDTHSEFSTGAVTELYEGDVALNKVADGRALDSNNVGYWYQTSDTAVTTKDFSADVTGFPSENIGDVMAYLLRFFSDDADIFDLTSLDVLSLAFNGVSLAFAANARVSDGALGIVRNRISQILPFSIIQRGSKYSFLPLLWERHVTKHLSTEKNIIRKVSGPTETPRANIYNSFLVKYGLSGFRGDHTGSVAKDFDTNQECDISKKRYGERVMPDVNAGDLADLASASWLMTWLIETYSKNRVSVSYICDLDCVDVQIWDTVSVEDIWEGWTHRPLFKVVGIHRGTGGTIKIDLISIDDYVDVYQVNQPVIEYDPVIAPDDYSKWWNFGTLAPAPVESDYLSIIGPWPSVLDYTITMRARHTYDSSTVEGESDTLFVERHGSLFWTDLKFKSSDPQVLQCYIIYNTGHSDLLEVPMLYDQDKLIKIVYNYAEGIDRFDINNSSITLTVSDFDGTNEVSDSVLGAASDPVWYFDGIWKAPKSLWDDGTQQYFQISHSAVSTRFNGRIYSYDFAGGPSAKFTIPVAGTNGSFTVNGSPTLGPP